MIKNIKINLLIITYILVVFSLFLYSFTQVDLSLTLSQISIWQVVQKFFQNIGYFNRPLSASFYLVIISLLSVFYIFFLSLANKNKISKRQTWILILGTTFILGFSYNAFSYDLFNYIFDAKIITYYQQNPYFQKALDYPNDPMLSFMHWTHRVYPYGPVWLGLTVPLSFLGFHFFLPTFFLFKILAMLSFVGTVYYIGKIVQKVSPRNEVFSIIFFSLNPLILVEGLVSAHNDITMMFFAVLGFYLLVSGKYFLSFLFLALSVGVKFATVFLFPVFLLYLFFIIKKKNIAGEKLFLLSLLLMLIAVVFASLRTNFQPWYLFYVLPFAALLGKKYYILVPAVIVSLFALFQYAPFLYLGNWNPPVPAILSLLTTAAIVMSALFVVIWIIKIKYKRI